VSLHVELENLLASLLAARQRQQPREYADLAMGCIAVLENHGYRLGWSVLTPQPDEWCLRLCAEFEAGIAALSDGNIELILLGAVNVLKFHMRAPEGPDTAPKGE
jgi:hypothetical protein